MFKETHDRPLYLNAIKILLIFLSVSATAVIVYLTEGMSSAFTHLMYIPIILSAYFFGFTGVACTALFGGFALGPFMPQNAADKLLMQEPWNWLLRTALYLIVGELFALLLDRLNMLRKTELDKAFRDAVTGLPNANKLKKDLDRLNGENARFSLIGFRISNLDSINRYIGYDIGLKSLMNALEFLQGESRRLNVYSMAVHQYIAVVPGACANEARALGAAYLGRMKSLSIDGFPVMLNLRGCVVECPIPADDPEELLKKVDIALDKSAVGGIYVYNDLAERENKERCEMIVSLLRAVKNEEFSVVYQPQVTSDNRVKSVEALIRWNDGAKGAVSPGEFIRTAEEIGLINDITKWVIKTIACQIKAWRGEGLAMKVAINMSSLDLRDDSVIAYLKKTIEENGVDPGSIEIELTERSIMENEEKVTRFLKDLREQGYKIALDDF